MKMKRVVSFCMVCLLTTILLSGCSTNHQREKKNSDEHSLYTIDVFDGLANYMGIQKGWFGEQVKEKFGLELNIVAPNVAGSGDTLFQTRSASGNLGDLIIVDNGTQYNELVRGGLLYDMSELYKQTKYVSKYDKAVQYINKDEDGIFGFPTSVSNLSPDTPSEGLDLNYGAYSRWDLYKKLNYPEIDTLENILPIIEEMRKLEPETSNGKKVYGFSLFSDWDGNMMSAGKQLATLYGFDELGFVLAKADGSEYQDILDSESEYIRALKFYFKANQLGLVDPESTTQNYDTLYTKFQDGQVLFSWWPWLGKDAYNTEENLNLGKGFMLLPIKDQMIFSYGAELYGGKQFIGIGSEAKDPEKIIEFIDWLYSPEGIQQSAAQTQNSAGIEGLTWEKNNDNKCQLTDFGKKVFLGSGSSVPSEYGGGEYKDGISALNVSPVLAIDINPETGEPYNYTLWESYQKENSNTLQLDWSEKLNAMNTLQYLQDNNQILVAPGASYVAPEDSSDIATLRSQIGSLIVEYSWKMVFAKDEREFDSLLNELQKSADGLGYKKILAIDIKNAKIQNDRRISSLNEFTK